MPTHCQCSVFRWNWVFNSKKDNVKRPAKAGLFSFQNGKPGPLAPKGSAIIGSIFAAIMAPEQSAAKGDGNLKLASFGPAQGPKKYDIKKI